MKGVSKSLYNSVLRGGNVCSRYTVTLVLRFFVGVDLFFLSVCGVDTELIFTHLMVQYGTVQYVK